MFDVILPQLDIVPYLMVWGLQELVVAWWL